MRIYTGRSHLLEPALIRVLRDGVGGTETQIVVVPKQLTLQTERTLLSALNLRGSFQLQVLSPERLCARVFEAAGQPEGARVDERGRVMLVRAAVQASEARLKLYRGAQNRRGFAERCARQLELIRQAGLTPGRLYECAERSEGLLAMKLDDLAVILEAYEDALEGRFQDGETEFHEAVLRAGDAAFLRDAEVFFYGFDLTPPTLHALMGVVAAACPRTHVFLPLENDEKAADFDAFLPMKACFLRLCTAAKQAHVRVTRVRLEEGAEAEGVAVPRAPEPWISGDKAPEADDAPLWMPAEPLRLGLDAPVQHPELRRLSRELFAFPAEPDPAAEPPKRVQLAMLKNPVEECRFAAALCRRMAMRRGWRWNDMLILCRDLERYHQPLREAFRAYDVPLFLSTSRATARHALPECLLSALALCDRAPQPEDALSLMRTGCMPISADDADRLANHARRYGLRPRGLLSPLKRGTSAEIEALEPVREAFAAPVNALRNRLRRAKTLREQLAALFGFLTDIDAAARLEARLDALIAADLREQASEEGQVWNRVIGALDQMAALMGEAPLSVAELRQTLCESLEAAVIKPLPQSDDAVFAQTTDRIAARPVKALIILGETDRPGADADALLSGPQMGALSRMTRTWLGSDDAELSRMRRFYLKSALGMASDYACVSWPMSDVDGAPQHPGALIELVRGVFPRVRVRGGLTDDASMQRMLRGSGAAALSFAARALSDCAGGAPLPEWDAAALAALRRLSGGNEALSRALGQMRAALNHAESAERMDPANARALYGELRRQSVTRLERFAQCPFAYFTQYGLRPERIDPYELSVRDEGTFFHEAVHEFLQASMDDLNALEPDAAAARMDDIAERLLDAMEDGPLGDTAVAMAERRRLKATARTCAGVLANHMRQSRFTTAALEADFGTEDGAARLIVNAVTGECTLEGRIDRIDEWAEGGYLRVIDYKRGGRALALDAVYHGLSLQLPVYLAAALRKRGGESAGVYYFNLDEGILSLQSTDPNEVEKQRRARFRLSGLAPSDPEVLRALSPSFSEVMNVRATRDGALYKGALAADAAGFRALMDRALQKAGEHLDGIRGGLTAVAPASFRQRTPCEYCEWRSACLFDARMDAACVRRFRPIKPEAVLEELTRPKREDSPRD